MQDEIFEAYDRVITEKEEVVSIWEVLLIIENGILRVANENEKIDPKKWHFFQTDKTEKYTVWNFDVESAKPLAKSILNELWLFPELLYLKSLLWLTWGILFVAVVTVFLSFNTFKQKDALTMFNSITEGIHKLETLKPQISQANNDNF